MLAMRGTSMVEIGTEKSLCRENYHIKKTR